MYKWVKWKYMSQYISSYTVAAKKPLRWKKYEQKYKGKYL